MKKKDAEDDEQSKALVAPAKTSLASPAVKTPLASPAIPYSQRTRVQRSGGPLRRLKGWFKDLLHNSIGPSPSPRLKRAIDTFFDTEMEARRVASERDYRKIHQQTMAMYAELLKRDEGE